MLPPYAWKLRVASPAKDRATVFTRKHQFVVGPPITFDEADPHVSALEYALGAFAAELVVGLRQLADQRRLAIDAAEATLQAELHDALAHVGVVGQGGSPALARVEVTVYVASFEAEPAIRALWDEALARSPLYRTLAPSVKLELKLKLST